MGRRRDTFNVKEYMTENRFSVKENDNMDDVSAELRTLGYKINDYYKHVGELAWAMSQAGINDREIDKWSKEFEKVRDHHDKLHKKLAKKYDL